MKPKASKQAKPAQGGLSIRDIILVVFRHKWKICLLSLLGLAAAAFVHLQRTPAYVSSSKLLVRYIVQHSAVDAFDNQATPSTRGGGPVIDAEIEILTSWDLAVAVGEAIGASVLIPESEAELTPLDAANAVAGGLEVSAKRDSNVISVTYQGSDPEVTVDVLRELVSRYFEKHLEIHRSKKAFEKIVKDADLARVSYKQVSEELDGLRASAGVLSWDSAGESLDSQRGNARGKLLDAETELVGQRARVKALKAILGDGKNGQAPAQVKRADPEAIAEYQELSGSIADLRQARMERLTKFKANDSVVQHLEGQILQLANQRAELLEDNPGLMMQAAPAGGNAPAGPDLMNEETILAGLEAKVGSLNDALEKLDRQFGVLSESSSKVEDLKRLKQTEAERLTYLEKRLERFRVDIALNPENMPHIKIIQSPSAPKEIYNSTTKTIVLGLAGSGLVIGLALAFLIDLVLDRRVKAPLEIQTRLQVPLLMSIPYVRPKLRGNQLLIEDSAPAGIEMGSDDFAVPAMADGGGTAVFNGAANGFILPYAEAIRNRIIFNFELNKINHKPKLIALTGLSEGAGTSTVAAGLAKAFSQADDVKVLLVDLNRREAKETPLIENGSHHSLDGALKVARHTQFKNGGPSLHFARIPAQTNGASSFTPLHLHGMLPDFRASDFDYIIFDMPKVDSTSPTLAMAGLMDKVLLVLDGDNTDREELQWGYSELTRGQADVSCVFNKSREVGPRWLLGEA